MLSKFVHFVISIPFFSWEHLATPSCSNILKLFWFYVTHTSSGTDTTIFPRSKREMSIYRTQNLPMNLLLVYGLRMQIEKNFIYEKFVCLEMQSS